MKIKSTYFDYLRFTKSQKWSKFLLQKQIPISDLSYDRKNDVIHVKPVDHSFSFGQFPLFFELYRKYCWKFLDNGFKFAFDESGVFVKVNDLTIKVDTLEEIFIINEVFIENIYKIECNNEYVVFDIGMNVGIASLYLSQFSNILKIYGFEPFKPTFLCAKQNLDLNKKYRGKIHINNFGLSDEDKIIDLPFDNTLKGTVGIRNSGFISKSVAKSIERIELRKASEHLKTIIRNHPQSKIFAKIDCEGSEYNILEDLSKSKMLGQVDLLVVEWHQMEDHKNRLKEIIKSLKEESFVVFTVGSMDNEIGMMYAIKNKTTSAEQ